ncbi:MAG: glycosyltransferase family 4 protein, partial [Solirubrobacterales bacterium]
MLRVCYLMPRLLPTPAGGVVGGSAANCVSLAIELRRQGVAIELLASLTPGDADRMANSPLGEILRPLTVSGKGLIGKGLVALCSLRRGLKARLRESRFDVVHSHSGTYPYAAVPLAADGRTCVRLHSLYCPVGARGGVYSRWWERPIVARTLFERLDRVVAVTGNVRQSIAGIGVSAGKIESVPMCVDTQRFRPRERDGSSGRVCDADDSIRLLYIGNASKEKGLVSLLHAVKKLLDGGIRVSLVAAIENQSNVKEYAAGHELVKRLVGELGIDKNVRFLGLVDRIENLYAES